MGILRHKSPKPTMSVIFSRQCEYAIQAVLYVALEREEELISIKELARRLRIPYHFLAKIFQRLTRKGLLVSQKGPAGGFKLGKPAGQITLYEIVEAIDGVGFSSNCVLGFPECSGANPCAVHEQWSGVRDEISAMLARRNVAQVAREMKKPEYRGRG